VKIWLGLAAVATALGSASVADAARGVIPYLSQGAGVYVEEATGLPVAGGERPLAPGTPGLHFLPPLVILIAPPPPPPAAPPPPPPTEPPPPSAPPPPADPVYVIDPAIGGYYRPDLGAGVGIAVFCRSDATWPAELPTATGYWTPGGTQITLRTRRCEGIVPSQARTELWARGLFVLAHEAAHSRGLPDECDADRAAIADMPDLARRIGFTVADGEAGRDLLLAIYRAAPLPPPYCLGSF
jgi:hypothetical protein